jgi:hypothetical protein
MAKEKLDDYKRATLALHAIVWELGKLEMAVRQLQKKTTFGQLMAAIKRLERQTLDAICEVRKEAETLEPPPLKADLRPVPRRQVN